MLILLQLLRDSPFQAQSQNPAVNTGFAARRVGLFELEMFQSAFFVQALCAGSALVAVYSPLALDISQSGLSFPAGSELKVKVI